MATVSGVTTGTPGPHSGGHLNTLAKRGWAALAAVVAVGAGAAGIFTATNSGSNKTFVVNNIVVPVPSNPASCPSAEEPGLEVGRPSTAVVWLRQKSLTSQCWESRLGAQGPGTVVRFLLGYRNVSDRQQDSVVVRVSLPPHSTLVPESTSVFTSTVPGGSPDTSDNLANGGLDIGSYAIGAGAYVTFALSFPGADNLACGITTDRLVGVVKPQGLTEFYNTSEVQSVKKKC